MDANKASKLLLTGAAGSLLTTGITALFTHNAQSFEAGMACVGAMALAGTASMLYDVADKSANKKENAPKI